MRISLLLAREPFGTIVERTLERFLPVVTGVDQRVEWRDPPGRAAPGAQRFWVQAYLNAISHERTPRGLHAPLMREFGTSLSKWRRPLQRAYMELSVAPGFRRWLSRAALDVTPGFPSPEEWLIVGGGNKIRVLHGASERCWAVVKAGFPARFFERETCLRREATAAGVSVPELIEVDREAGWACERFVSGTPLNRLSDDRVARKILERVAEPLAAWSRATTAMRPTEDVAAPLLETARRRLDSIGVFDADLRVRSENAIGTLERRVLARPSDPIPWSRAHGDFQPGNVLHGRRDWIIDWEHAGDRPAGYDPLVWQLATRFPAGLAGRFARFEREGAGGAADWLRRWLDDAGGRTPVERRATLDRLALAEFAMRLDELDVAPLRVRPIAYDVFLAELERWLAEAA